MKEGHRGTEIVDHKHIVPDKRL